MSQPPYPGQYPEQPRPYPGVPNPDVPQSVPPQPGFPPPAYGQPSYPPPGYPGYGPPPPKRKSRALPITLVSIGVVLVLCLGGGTAAFLLVSNAADSVAEDLESATPAPTGTGVTETPSAEPARTITITEPKTLGGRPKLTSKEFAALNEQIESDLADIPDATKTVGSMYGTPAKRDLVLMAAAQAPIDDPEQQMDTSFTGTGLGGLDLQDVVDIDPGPLGGYARCGDVELAGEKMAVCAWVDEGSSGWISWYFKSVKQVRGQFVKIRGEVEKES